jgi:hypothetical protein
MAKAKALPEPDLMLFFTLVSRSFGVNTFSGTLRLPERSGHFGLTAATGQLQASSYVKSPTAGLDRHHAEHYNLLSSHHKQFNKNSNADGCRASGAASDPIF